MMPKFEFLRETMSIGEAPTLNQVLFDRDMRVQYQNKLARLFPDNVILVLKVNMPGPVKRNETVDTLLKMGAQKLFDALALHQWGPIFTKEIQTIASNTLFVVTSSMDVDAVKKMTVSLEDTHPIGRLLDVDVFQNMTAKSRTDLGMPSRRCYVCNGDAKTCGRQRKHSVDALHDAMFEIIKQEGIKNDKEN